MSRAEIEAHPQLCQWLNNPYVKDNMELAIKFAEAEQGTFQQKKDFVEYYMCNGPELEADTLLYYREKILIDPVYKSIGYTYYSDIDNVAEIRYEKYGKDNLTTSKNRHGNNYDWFNCFKNPCNYLGPFSARQGHIGDIAISASNANNTLAERAKQLGLQGSSMFTPGPTGNGMSDGQTTATGTVPPAQGASGNTPAEIKGGPIPRWAIHLMPPAMQQEYANYLALRD